MENDVTVDTVQSVAESVHERMIQERGGEWVDCFDVSHAVKNELIEEHGVYEGRLTVERVFPVPEYAHYVLEIGWGEHTKPMVVDASYKQFDASTDTPVNLGEDSDETLPSVIVVSPASSYLFY